MKETKHALFPIYLLVALILTGCAAFRLDKSGGVISGCVDTTPKGHDACHDSPKVPQDVSDSDVSKDGSESGRPRCGPTCSNL